MRWFAVTIAPRSGLITDGSSSYGIGGPQSWSSVQPGTGPHAFATDRCGIMPTVWYAIVPSTSTLTKLFTGSTQSRITSRELGHVLVRSMGASTPSPVLGCTSAVDCIAQHLARRRIAEHDRTVRGLVALDRHVVAAAHRDHLDAVGCDLGLQQLDVEVLVVAVRVRDAHATEPLCPKCGSPGTPTKASPTASNSGHARWHCT